MAAATAKVQEAMGSQAAFLTTDQIQEALWHYYYDVEKSVAYLTKKFISPPKEKKAAGVSVSFLVHTTHQPSKGETLAVRPENELDHIPGFVPPWTPGLYLPPQPATTPAQSC